MREEIPAVIFLGMFCLPFYILAFLLSGLIAGTVSAQSLAEKRATFDGKVVTILESVNRKYVAALRRLEKEYALEQNYEAAIAVRDERFAVEELLSNGVVSPGVTETTTTANVPGVTKDVVFAGSDASLLDGSSVEGDALKFSKSGQSGEWQLENVIPGGYEVMVTYACNEKATLQAMEHFFRITADVPATGGSDAFKTVSMGTLKITSRAEKLSLSLKNGAGLLLQDVKLVSNRE